MLALFLATIALRSNAASRFHKKLDKFGAFTAAKSNLFTSDRSCVDEGIDKDKEVTCMFAKTMRRREILGHDQRGGDYEDEGERISVGENDHFAPLQVMCEVNGYMIPAILDTGAQITIMSSSCAKRCHISNNIDTRYSGRAVGVGSSTIIGRISSLPMRIGPINFDGCVSVLHESRVDFLIGLDFLKRFKCEISIKNNILTLIARDRVFKVPLMTASGSEQEDNLIPHSQMSDEDYYEFQDNDDSSSSYDSLGDNMDPLSRIRSQTAPRRDEYFNSADRFLQSKNDNINSLDEMTTTSDTENELKKQFRPISGLMNTLSGSKIYSRERENSSEYIEKCSSDCESMSLEGV